MGMGNIDPNLGLVQKPLPNSGPMISMVKGRPGVYWDAAGEPATDDMAIAAGFDLKRERLMKRKDELLAEATAEIEADFKAAAAAIEAGIDEELARTSDDNGAGDGAGSGDPDNGEPFVTTNANGRPRSARIVQGGPIRDMTYAIAGEKRGWAVKDRDSGQVYDEGLDEEKAVEILLEE